MSSRFIVTVALLCFAFPCSCLPADNPPVPKEQQERKPRQHTSKEEAPVIGLDYQNAKLSDVLKVYELMSGTTVWLHAPVDALVDISIKKTVSRMDACNVITQTLLQKYGIEMKEIKDVGILVDWTNDEKFKNVRERTQKMAKEL